jgi:hypothetical protein
VGANKKGVDQSNIPIRNNGLKSININKPKGVKPKMRERELRSDVNWQEGIEALRRKINAR